MVISKKGTEKKLLPDGKTAKISAKIFEILVRFWRDEKPHFGRFLGAFWAGFYFTRYLRDNYSGKMNFLIAI